MTVFPKNVKTPSTMTFHRCVAFLGLFLTLSVQSFTPCIPAYGSEQKSSRNLCLQEQNQSKEHGAISSSLRRQFLTSLSTATALSFAAPQSVNAAPPISIIAEELGYFPVTNKEGKTVYIPKKVSRTSSDQAIALAQHLKSQNMKMYGAFWCPHCARQRELFGKEAWSFVNYVECAPQGFGAQVKMCRTVNGFPEWKVGTRTIASGEVPLSALATLSGFTGFDETLEKNVPPLVGGSACK